MSKKHQVPHKYTIRSDISVKKMLKKHKATGYGIYWMIMENLQENDNNLNTDYEGIAYDLRVDVEIVKSIINDFNLFVVNNDYFYSEIIKVAMHRINDKSNKARESAKKRWDKQYKHPIVENTAKTESFDKDSVMHINRLKEIYLSKTDLMQSFCKGQKTDIKTIKAKLVEFNQHLSDSDNNMRSWSDYTVHFRNWFKKNKEINISKSKPQKITF